MNDLPGGHLEETAQRSILVVDDERDRLDQLTEALREALSEIEIRPWFPERGQDHLERFEDEVSHSVGLIVTDQDLTKAGGGLLGSSITTWGQDRFVPVCNFSRQPDRKLPRESNFFELRVPTESNDAARAEYVAKIFHGFQSLRHHIATSEGGTRPTATLLAGAMGLPSLQDDLAPYLTSVGSANSSFMRSVVESGLADDSRVRADFLSFVLGHTLVNAVLEFPGPILSRRTLSAYCAVSEEMADELASLFAEAAYSGPFSSPEEQFQRMLVDRQIDKFAASLDDTPADPGQYNRAVVEHALERDAIPHGCTRCAGTRGGLWCPFTRRAVCDLEECSIVSNEWIPRGANLCRVERDYFDEWSPLLLGE